MKKTILFSFANQKGGVGKSTLTSVVANYIHSNTDHSICVVDANDIQRTISLWREQDKEDGANEDELYDLLPIDSEKFPKAYTEILNGEYDFVAVDLPGNLKQPGVVSSLVFADLVIVPMNLSPADITSSNQFINAYMEEVKPRRDKNKLKTEVIGVLSKIDKRTIEAKNAHLVKEKFKIPFLSQDIPYKPVIFGRNANTSFNYNVGGGDKFIDKFCKEVLSHLEKLRKK